MDDSLRLMSLERGEACHEMYEQSFQGEKTTRNTKDEMEEG